MAMVHSKYEFVHMLHMEKIRNLLTFVTKSRYLEHLLTVEIAYVCSCQFFKYDYKYKRKKCKCLSA